MNKRALFTVRLTSENAIWGFFKRTENRTPMTRVNNFRTIICPTIEKRVKKRANSKPKLLYWGFIENHKSFSWHLNLISIKNLRQLIFSQKKITKPTFFTPPKKNYIKFTIVRTWDLSKSHQSILLLCMPCIRVIPHLQLYRDRLACKNYLRSFMW